MIVVDACVMIALLDGDDPNHQRAIEIFQFDPNLVASPLSLAEALVHPARADQAEAATAALQVTGLGCRDLRESDAIRLAKIRATTGLKMPDAVALALAQRLDATLATFDKSLTRAATDLGVKTFGPVKGRDSP